MNIHFHVLPRYEDDKIMIQFAREQAEENELDKVISLLQEKPKKQEENKEEKPKQEKTDDIEKEIENMEL